MSVFKWFFLVSILNAGMNFHAFGNRSPAGRDRLDSLLPVRNVYHQDHDEEIEPELANTESEYAHTGNMRKALVSLLKMTRGRGISLTGTARYKLFSDLAVFSARLKLYPLAMRCYWKALEYKRIARLSAYWSPTFEEMNSVAADSLNDNYFFDSASYGRLISIDTSLPVADRAGIVVKSEPVKTAGLWGAFDDGKTASSYALIIHVKQPVPGRRKAFTHINNVGHMFITLIKYNNDNTVVCRSFGFYPHKTGFFSATPVHPGSPATFKDDALHDWDEAVGKFISGKRFQKIIETLKRYDRLTYHLSRNNCTDFGLRVATTAGIDIGETRGAWPLGKGNNPANAGQSILEGKYRNLDADYQQGLFFSSNIQPGKD